MSKCALFEVELHVIEFEGCEGICQVLNVRLHYQTLDHYIVDIDFHNPTYFVDEHFIHQPSISCPAFFNPNGIAL